MMDNITRAIVAQDLFTRKIHKVIYLMMRLGEREVEGIVLIWNGYYFLVPYPYNSYGFPVGSVTLYYSTVEHPDMVNKAEEGIPEPILNDLIEYLEAKLDEVEHT